MAISQVLNRLAITRDRQAAFDLSLIDAIVVGAALAFLLVRLRVSGFSPDGRAFFRLPKTMFGDHFYKFNICYSYFSETRSVLLPFGYPFVIAAAQTLFGTLLIDKNTEDKKCRPQSTTTALSAAPDSWDPPS